jgi:hypothetical protein
MGDAHRGKGMTISTGPGAILGAQRRAVRNIAAPTEAEARQMAAPVLVAFQDAGWSPEDDLWIPPDRRVGLGESLLLDAEDRTLLEAEGHLRLTFTCLDPGAVEPAVEPAVRTPDVFEEIGGVRYRRLVPRYAIGLVVFVIGALVMLSIWGSMATRQPGLGGPNYGKPILPGVTDPDANGNCGPGLSPITVVWLDGSSHQGCFTP